MGKKRKHEQDFMDEEEGHQRKKIAKKQSHNISSSDTESMSKSPKKKKKKEHLDLVQKNKTNINGHLLSSEQDSSIEENQISEIKLSTKKQKFKKTQKKHEDESVKIRTNFNDHLLNSGLDSSIEENQISIIELSTKKQKLKKTQKKHSVESAKSRTNFNDHLLNSGHDSSIEEDYVSTTTLLTQKVSKRSETLVNGQSDSEQDSPGPFHSDSEFVKPKHIQNKNDRSSIGVNSKVSHQKHSGIDEEELAAYSSLISEKLCEQNNIWILQCPSNMDCTSLVNQRLNLSGSDYVSVGESQYETYSYPNNESKFTTLAVPSIGNEFNLRRIPIAGHIIIEESIQNENSFSSSVPEPPKSVELPENLRMRHPLLGTDYKNQPKTASRIHSVSKKKKHKRMHSDINDELMETDELLSTSPNKLKKKKKEKSRHSTLEFGMQSSSGVDDSTNIGLSEKKKKHKNTDDSGGLSGVFESKLNSSSSIETSKNRKRKRHSSTDDLGNISIQEQHSEEIYEEDKVKRKKKKHHHDS